MKRILFVHNQLTRFAQVDRDLLAERYAVTERHEAKWRRLRPAAIRRQVAAHDLVFCWFASWHSLLPVLFARRAGKPSIVVIGGYDTACVPEAAYGSQRGGPRRLVSRAVIRTATHLLPFSESARCEAVDQAGAAAERTTVLHLAARGLHAQLPARREKLVVTVGNVWRENLSRKGLLPFVEAAALLPDVQFVHAGRWCDESIDELRKAAGPNVRFLGFVSDAELGALYARASVYVQASLHEGFGLSVAEAMLAGCVPAVTRAGSLPEVAGDAGVYLASQAPQDVARAVRAALNLDPRARHRARHRVQTLFSLERRRAGLHELVDRAVRSRAA